MSDMRSIAATVKDIRFVEAECAGLELSANDQPNKPKRFTMSAYTGGKLNLGYGVPVVVNLEGMKVPRNDLPILRQHDAERIVAHTDQIDKSERRLKVSGVMSGVGEAAKEVLSLAANSFPWQASIGAAVEQMDYVERGETVKVNGRNFEGPIYVAVATTLREVSFVPIGADGATSASVAAKYQREKPMFEQWLTAKGFDPAALSEVQRVTLKAGFDAEEAKKATAVVQAATAPAQAMPAAAKDNFAPTAGKGVADIVAAQRAENARVETITQLTAQFCKECPSRVDEIEALAKDAIEGKWDVDKIESKLTMLALRAANGGPVVISKHKPETNSKVVEAAASISLGLKDVEKVYDQRTLEAAHEQYGGSIGLLEIVDVCARANGFRGTAHRNRRDALRAAFSPHWGQDLRASVTPSTISISGILSNVANKFVRENFMFVEQEWRKITSTRSVRDFKQISSYSLTGDLQYEKIAPGGEIKHGTLGDETYNNQADSYGKLLGIDRRDLINDDLGALASVSKRLGRGGALKLNDVFWTAFMDNSSFFSTGNGNYDDGTDTALTSDGLVAADILWQAMTDPDGKPMGTMAKYLVCPPNLRIAAWRLMNSQLFTSQDEEGSNNPWAGMFEIVTSKYLNNSAYTGYSTKAWYLLCDPNDIPVIETCFLNGQEMPTIETAELDFDRLGIALRAYHDFGVAKQEPRGGYKFKGEA